MRADIHCETIKRCKKLFWMMLVCLTASLAGCGSSGTEELSQGVTEEGTELPQERELFAMVCRLDEVNQKMTLLKVTGDTELVLRFSVGTEFKNKYGDLITLDQVLPGSLADVVYDVEREKVLSVTLSGAEQVTELSHVTGVQVDQANRELRVNGVSYHMAGNARAFSDGQEIELHELCQEDEVTLWLYNEQVCSAYVELGHGYVRLSDYASYLGGMVEIGESVMAPVSENMLLTVQEGEHMLRISKGDQAGTKRIKVVKNRESEVSLADLVVEPQKTGSVLFVVKPSGAEVRIDGKRVNTEGAVELSYGKHRILITADGYEPLSASFNVKYAYKVKEYSLVKTGEDAAQSTTAYRGKTVKKTEERTSKGTETVTDTESQKAGTAGSGSASSGSASEESETASEEAELTKAEGDRTKNKVTVTAPVGVSVYFDGEYLGITPISFTKVTGSHIITLSQTGYLSKSYTVIFTDDGKDPVLTYEGLVSISELIGIE